MELTGQLRTPAGLFPGLRTTQLIIVLLRFTSGKNDGKLSLLILRSSVEHYLTDPFLHTFRNTSHPETQIVSTDTNVTELYERNVVSRPKRRSLYSIKRRRTEKSEVRNKGVHTV